jgi:glucan phosphoethanolaminetransferase (alkaline phosphatase superfamily)
MEKNIKVYWLVLIVVLIISVFVFIETSNTHSDLVQYFSFAGSITSLVLGLIAIFYSIISNQESTTNFGKLKEAVTKIEEGADIIKTVSETINLRLDRISDDLVKFGTKENQNQTTETSELVTEEQIFPVPDSNPDLPDTDADTDTDINLSEENNSKK